MMSSLPSSSLSRFRAHAMLISPLFSASFRMVSSASSPSSPTPLFSSSLFSESTSFDPNPQDSSIHSTSSSPSSSSSLSSSWRAQLLRSRCSKRWKGCLGRQWERVRWDWLLL